MKKISLLIVLLVIIVFGAYMNFAYGRIYNEIGKKNLQPTDKIYTYQFTSDTNNAKNIVYVALGDSLTSGTGVDSYNQSYAYLIAEKLAGKNNITFIDRSTPGFTTYNIKNEMLPLAISDKPNIITLFIGVNDVRGNISKENFKNNYEYILKNLTQKTSAKIYVVNIPFLGSSSLILPPYNYYFDYKTKRFNEIIKNLATENNVQYIDLYSPTKKEFTKSNSYYSVDLFHPSAKGYNFWANIIYANFNK